MANFLAPVGLLFITAGHTGQQYHIHKILATVLPIYRIYPYLFNSHLCMMGQQGSCDFTWTRFGLLFRSVSVCTVSRGQQNFSKNWGNETETRESFRTILSCDISPSCVHNFCIPTANVRVTNRLEYGSVFDHQWISCTLYVGALLVMFQVQNLKQKWVETGILGQAPPPSGWWARVLIPPALFYSKNSGAIIYHWIVKNIWEFKNRYVNKKEAGDGTNVEKQVSRPALG